MILSDKEIKLLIEDGTIGISDYNPDLVNPSSLDVRLGEGFGFASGTRGNLIDPLDKKSFSTHINEGAREYILPPGGFVLAQLQEKLRMPNNVSAQLKGKSSLARLGADVCSFGAWIDPCFEGSLTLEIANHSQYHLKLTSGMRIGQLIFYLHEEVENPYSGRYQGQAGVEGSKGV